MRVCWVKCLGGENMEATNQGGSSIWESHQTENARLTPGDGERRGLRVLDCSAVLVIFQRVQ